MARQSERSRTKTSGRGWRRFAFPFFAVFVGLLPFLILELVLILCGVGKPQGTEDPFVGFSGIYPLFELDQSGKSYHTAQSKRLFFGPQRFEKSKPEKAYRVFCLGGSTVRGRPYETNTSFAKWLEIELQAGDPGHRYQSINCGGLSYASYRLRRVLKEVLDHQPDLIILATGHNEFLEDRSYQPIKERSGALAWLSDRVYSMRSVTVARRMLGAKNGPTLESEVKARLDEQSGYASYKRDDEWRAGVIRHFETSVRAMIDQCRDAGVPVVIVGLGSNLRDCPPFKSEHKPSLAAGEQRKWQKAFDRGTSLDLKDPQKALVAYREAEAIDDEHALLNYRIARCFDRLANSEEARKYYLRARDWDICPLRMLSPMEALLDRIAADTNVPFLDARGLIETASHQSIPGHDTYVDHVHPTIRAHQRMAAGLVAVLRKRRLVAGDEWSATERQTAYHEYFRRLPKNYLGAGSRRIGWLENWARRERLFEETLPVDDRGVLHQIQKRIGFGDGKAWPKLGELMDSNPRTEARVMNFALDLFRGGRTENALQAVDKIIERYGDKQPPLSVLAAQYVLLLDLGRTADAGKAREAAKASFDDLPPANPWRGYLPP